MNCFLDIGANVGQTFDDFLLKTNEFDGWKVFCFEPSPRHIAGLLERVKPLRSRFDITICPFAIAEPTRLAYFHEKDDPRGDSLQLDLWQGGYVSNRDAEYQILTSCVSLPEFIQKYVELGDLVVKLDCEGAEYGILRSLLDYPAVLQRISRLMVEFHATGANNGSDRAAEELLFAEFTRAGKPWEIWPY